MDQTVMLLIRSVAPKFRNNHDKVAFAVHASFLASDYILTATGRSGFADDALSSSPSQDAVGIDGWNEFDGEYAFVYRKQEKGSKKVLVKCLVIDDKLVVTAIADGGAEPSHLEIEVGNYAEERTDGDYSAQFKDFGKLVTVLRSSIIDKLDGVKPKPSSSRNPSSSETNEERGHYVGIPDPLGPQIHPSGVVVPPIPDGGYSDLFPGPGAGMYPHRGDFGDGSMFVGPSDPRFFGGDQPGFMGPPQPGMPPPGARFDPYGPPGVPGFEPGLFVRQPPRRPGNGMHPDLEQFPGGSDFI
ncbi:hypothetical protein AALP_AA5G172500 [Arabis alpina]|uniref:PI31 proteasome regulator N-terminal domain-containing protein n=1 Tax=Arabis alpina TaxID=50452 RepID=A0A087GXP2_ARAAL|nr:hypothetical protein AALP_AA5G172500 [Arabis alpina]